MRSRIKINGLWYRPVPWMREGECDGCAFGNNGEGPCINTTEYKNPCDNGNEFEGMVLIPNTKEAYEKYMHEAVLHKFDNAG